MSTIKVDTLQTRAGSTAAVTGAGFVATDQIRGNTAANSVTVVAEGGTNTTNLQQGLSKAWFNVDGTGTIAIRDSFNLTSVTDDGTGITDFAIANDMANDDYDFQSSTGNYHARSIDLATGTGEIRVYNTSHASVDADAFINLHGDLA